MLAKATGSQEAPRVSCGRSSPDAPVPLVSSLPSCKDLPRPNWRPLQGKGPSPTPSYPPVCVQENQMNTQMLSRVLLLSPFVRKLPRGPLLNCCFHCSNCRKKHGARPPWSTGPTSTSCEHALVDTPTGREATQSFRAVQGQRFCHTDSPHTYKKTFSSGSLIHSEI